MHIRLRPKTFDEVVGQDHIIIPLKEKLKEGIGGRAIFFSGNTGTGKTTLSFILASEFGAPKESIEHINCVHASTVAEMRECVSEFYKSSLFGGNKKVYIFDEPQELSHKAMSELLIPTENLPENVLVIMCSAEPEKVEDMLPERLYRFKTRPLSNSVAKTFLNSVCKSEGLKLDKFVKSLIIEKSEGLPRRILSSIPIIASLSDRDDITYALDLNALDVEDDIMLLFKALFSKKNKWDVVKGVLEKLLKSKSPNAIRMGLMNIIGYRLMSNYLKNEKEGLFLSKAYATLKANYGPPEKANLIVGVFKSYHTFLEYY